MKRIVKYIALVLIALASFVSCSEKIELDLNSSNTRLVVEGLITDQAGPQGVILTQSSSYFFNEPAPGVTDALVTLTDGGQEWQLTQESAGHYLLPQGFAGIPGTTYQLSIQHQNTQYEASAHLREVPMIDSLSRLPHPILPDRDFLVIHFQEPPQTRDFYMYHIFFNDSLVTDSINKVPFGDDDGVNGRYLSIPVYLFRAGEEAPQPGDRIRVQKFSISEEYFQFMIALRRNQGTVGGPFTGPPANVPGNINNGALGFFLASAVSEVEMVIE
ncbi:MAG: DUF4249 domain-containing protein [Bacteroidales bacterium]|nr:DUF4249 domain-containing protein [Bacteroidales bacterium]